jgi:hypothetical protein
MPFVTPGVPFVTPIFKVALLVSRVGLERRSNDGRTTEQRRTNDGATTERGSLTAIGGKVPDPLGVGGGDLFAGPSKMLS